MPVRRNVDGVEDNRIVGCFEECVEILEKLRISFAMILINARPETVNLNAESVVCSPDLKM